jgi:hypothetical protein
MSDPLTDLEAAKAFTAKHKHTPGGVSGGFSPIINWYTPKNGQPQCWCGVSTYDRITRFYQCTNVGKTKLADGSTWCGSHTPAAFKRRADAQAERDRVSREKWDAKTRAWRENQRRDQSFPGFLDALRQIEAGHNDPRALAREVLAKYDGETA